MGNILMMIFILVIITVLIITIDSILWIYYVNFWGFIGFIFAAVILYLDIKFNKDEEGINLNDIEGWNLGEGYDLEDPDNPKKINVVFDSNALKYGCLFVGGPGSGKSVAASSKKIFLVTHKPNHGYAYFDGKGDLDLYQTDVSGGAGPDFFFSSELPSSHHINVMDGPVESVIDYLTRVLVGKGSDYYGSAQQSALRKVVPLIKAFSVPCNLMDLWAVLTVSDAGAYLISKGKEEGIDKDVISTAVQYFSQDEDDRLKTIDGLLNKLYPFVSGTLRDRINAYEPTLDIESSVKNAKRVYWHFPLSETSKAIATMVTERYGVIAKDRQLGPSDDRPQYPLEFDDWGALFYDNFGKITARCRSAEMPISFYFQSKAQTDAVQMGNIFTSEIMDNIGALVVLRINGMDTAKWLAAQLGEYETQELSKSANNIISGESISTVTKFKVTANEIQDVSAGEAHIKMYITGKAGKLKAKVMKVRFPMPLEIKEKPKTWPVIEPSKNNDECEGLHLWKNYMDEDQRRLRKKESIEKALAEDFINE
jgi:energy-coupling factor transporter transmembrane protein EcfT